MTTSRLLPADQNRRPLDRTELPVQARWLPELAARLPGLHLPTRMHPRVGQAQAALADWAQRTGLAGDDRDLARLRAAGFDRMAARALAEEPLERVELFACWLAWLFAFDDRLDTGPDSRAPAAVHQLYAAVFAAARDPHRPHTTSIEAAFADLWWRTAGRVGPAWRARFLTHMDDQRRAWLAETTRRVTARPPTPGEYVEHRRSSAGRFIFDLPEAVLGIDLPAAVLATDDWQTLTDAANDVTAWCNDIASLPKELAAGEVHNHVIVTAHHLGCDLAAAVGLVTDQIISRCAQLPTTIAHLVELCGQMGLSAGQTRRVSRVATAMQALPGTHLEWLLESGRYTSRSTPGAVPGGPDGNTGADEHPLCGSP